MGGLSAEKLLPLLRTQALGRAMVCLDEVDSTFRVMRELEKQGAPHGCVVTAEAQTAGRGRFSRKWESEKGLGLYFNLLLRPQMPTQHAPRLIPAIAVGVCEALREMGFDAGIKWPNDIVVDGRKVCGMLMEMGGDAQKLRFVSAGIGLNVGQRAEDFPEELRGKAGSLAMFFEEAPERGEVLVRLLEHIEPAIALCLEDHAALLARYRELSVTLGREVVASGGSDVRGVAVDLNEDGELIVRDAEGVLHELHTGDVSVRGVMGYV